MIRRLSALLAALVLLAGVAPEGAAAQDAAETPSETVAIVGATVVHPDEDPVADATVVVEDGTIAAVGPSGDVAVPEGAAVMDASGKYVVPGLVDGHVHFFQSGGLYTRPDAIDLRAARSHAEEFRLIRTRLPDTFRRYLRSGVTSVVDVGGPMWNLDVRARADTTALAPTVVTAGPLISSVSRPSLSEGDPPIKKITSPEAAREEVRRQVEAGVDLVKIWYIVQSDETPAAYRPVVDATIDEAHDAGKRVAVHATQLETARAAVEAGADVLVHSVFDEPVDDAFVQLLKENDVLYTPTLMVGERYRETFAGELDLTTVEHRFAQKEVVNSLFDLHTLPDSLVPAGIQQRIRKQVGVAADTTAIRNLKRVHDAGVAVAAGTDAGNIGTPHGPALSREVELMREAGLTPQEILRTATAGGARLMGRDDLGRIAKGMQADLLVLNANPLDDVQHLFDLHRVVKAGRVYTPGEILPRTNEETLMQQVNAYNARDLDAFVDVYADSVAIYASPDSLLLRGKDAARQRYRERFQSPGLHSEILNRMSLGRTAIHRERVTGIETADGPVNAIAVYTFNADGQVARVDFTIDW
jgi:imidazolonepropionase-like amidohydrolase